MSFYGQLDSINDEYDLADVGLDEGRLLLWTAQATPDRQVALGVVRFETPAAARAYHGFAKELQRKQGSEQFAVLIPAGLPSEPFKPKPLRVMLMAIAAGFVLGGAGAIGREYLDRAVYDARGVRDEFELPVLAEIPRIEPAV